jgi:DNA-binding response OmpR family regulator
VLVGEGGTDSMGWRLPRPVKWMALFEILDEALGRPIDDAAAARTLHEHSPSALVVTGSSEIARTVDAHLINAGCKVLQVADGEEAIERLAIEPYACIVVDVALSGIGGLEIARIAKGRSGQRVIVLGSSGTPLERMRASMAGCDAYLPPPLNGQALVAAIDRCMR